MKTEENIISFVPIVVSLFISMLYNLTIISHQILLSLDTSLLTTYIYLTVYVCGFKVNQIYVDLFMYLIFVCFTGYQDCRFWDPINLYTGNTTTCLCLSQNKGLCFHSLLLLFSLCAFLLSWASRLVVVIMVCDIVSHCFCLILVKILTHQKVTW